MEGGRLLRGWRPRRFGVVASIALAAVLVFAVAAAANPTNQVVPTVTGSSGSPFTSGEALTVHTQPSDWTYSGSISFAYQWRECPAYAATVKGASPAGYWRLGEQSGAAKALDASGNAADGNYGGTVTLGQAGAMTGDPDTAAQFDGSTGFVEVPDATALDPTAGFSLEAWVKESAAPSAAQTIIAKPFTVGASQSYSLGITTAGKAVATIVTTSATYTATSTTVVTDGNWHLLDATWAPNSLKVYVDAGTAVAATTAGTLQYSSLPLEIGRFDSTLGQYFGGTLDDVAVYGTALSAAQITANHTAALTPESESGCVDIAGQTSSVLTLGDSNVGWQVYANVTATDANGPATVPTLSQAILPGSAPQPTTPANTSLPGISGTAAVGETLIGSPGTWSGSTPISYAYQWERCSGSCANISGATSSSYTVQSADAGSTLLLSVTASNSAGSASATSSQTATVTSGAVAPSNTVAPSVSGTVEANQTLTASPGTWQGTAPISIGYQWQTCPSYSSAVIADAPVAYWRLNDPSGTTATDSSGNGHNGTYSNVTLNATGALSSCDPTNAAGGFNGSSSYVSNSTNVGGFTLTTPFSVEAWFYTPSPGTEETLVANAYSTAGWNLRLSPSGDANHIRFALLTSGSAYRYVDSTATVSASQWHHVVATYDGSNSPTSGLKIYLDGTDVTGSIVNAGTLSTITTSNPVYLGRDNYSTPHYFNGSIDEVALFGSALSAARVQAHYQTGTAAFADVSGATASTFTVPSGDGGDVLRAKITASNSAGSTPAYSPVTAAVGAGAGPANTQLPSISGTPTVGETLTASPGSWSGSAPFVYSYQWQDCSSYSATIAANSPVAYWRLDDASGATSAADSSGHNSAATYNGSAGFGQAGALAGDADTAVGFDGLSTYLEAPDILNPNTSLSLEAWVKTTATSGVIIDQPYALGTTQSYALELSGGKAEAEVYAHPFGNPSANFAYTVTGTSAVDDGLWHHLVMTFGSGTLDVYVDGSLQASTSTNLFVQDSTLSLEIGRFDSAGNQYFAGSMDEVAIYGSTLSAGQVSADYHAGVDASGVAPCSNISGANDSTYTVASGDVGHKILVQVSAMNPDGTAGPVSSASEVIGGAIPVSLSAPTVSGTPAVGQTLTADPGAWSNNPTGYSYQWQRCQAYAGVVLADHPAGYWRLNEGSGTTANDSSGNAINGTYGSSVTLGAAGNPASCDPSISAASFNGTSGYMDTPSNSKFDLSQFSIEAWFKGTGSNPSGAQFIIDRASPENYGLYVTTTGHAQFRAYNSAGTAIFNFATTSVITGGGWYHLVATYDGTTANIYVNGVLDASKTASGTPDAAGGGVWVGRYAASGADYLAGTVSDVAVYPAALTATQVATHYQAGNSVYLGISGATGQTYSPTSSDTGNRLRVQVTATNGVGSATSLSASELVTSNAPTNSVIPSVSGSPQVGETLTASPGVWSSSSPITYGYQWQSAPSYQHAILTDSPQDYWRLGEPPGTTTVQDLGSAHVNGTYCCGSGLQLGEPGALSGDPDTAVNFQPGLGYVPLAASLSGNFTVEGWFNTTVPTGTQFDPIVSYSHYNNCAPASGTGDCAYPQVMVETASGKLEGHACDATDSCVSIATSTVENDGKWHQFEFERSGSSWTLYIDDTKVGSSATGAGGALTDGYNNFELGAAYSDDWGYSGLLDEVAIYPSALSAAQIDNHFKAANVAPVFTPIAGQTGATYTVQQADADAAINLRVEVTATNASGSTVVDSSATGSVTGSGGPVNTALPTISGSPAIGNTLVSSPGSWTGATPIGYAYQWQRITGGYANAVLADGPSAYWRLDEPSGTTLNDASGNGHTGSYSGNVALGQAGAMTGDADSSISLTDTNSYATAPDAPSLDTPNFTIEGWVRALTTSSLQKIVGKGPGTSEQWGLYIAPTTGFAEVQAEIGGAQVSLSGTGTSQDRVGDNTWHYVAATWDGTNLTLYWSDPAFYPSNPIQSTTIAETGKTLKTNTEQISIGKEVSSTTNQYPLSSGQHQLDDIAIYGKALTLAQITAHWNAGRTAPTITPVGSNSSSYALTSQDAGGALRAQVTATNANGSTAAYSLQTVPLGANSPTQALPPDGAASHTPDPVLSVNTVGGSGVSYEFQVAADKGFTSVVADSGRLPAPTTTWAVPTSAGLADGHTYYWRVDAIANGVPTSWSTTRSFRVLIKRLGTRSDWPIWSGDGVSVNETNGNFILGAPAGSFPTEIGPMGVTLAYNAQDSTNNGLGAGWTLSGGAAPPSKLIDHAVLLQFDAAEIVWPDGGSDYYDHVGSSNTYRSPPGSSDQLTKNKDGTWTLLSADGYIYSFGKANGTTGVAHLISAEASSTGVGKSVLTYVYNASGQLTSMYDSADPGRTVTLNWSCSSNLVCITGPDGAQWKYAGVSGASGALATVNDGTRTLVKFTYGTSGNGNGLITKIQNANDLDPSDASPGYNGTHAVSVTYDADKRVTSVASGPISGQTATWQFTYHLAGPYPTDATRANHADGPAGTIRQAAGYATITDPNGHQSQVYYDSADHPIETVDPLGRITEAGWNANNEQIWSEDGAGNPSDSTWDTVNNVLLSTQLPDSGSGRPTTTYRYDEKAVGTSSTQGPSLQGLRGQYFPNVNIAGRATTDRNDANVDFDWGASGPDAGVGASNFSARFTGDLITPSDGDYVFSTYSDSGTILVVDSLQVINAWTTNTKLGTQTSQPIHLAAGEHLIELDYFEGATAASHLHLLWSCATCSSPFTTQIVPASALAPAYENQTSAIDPLGRISFTHYANPAKAYPDYTLAQPGDGSNLITSLTYDAYGRVTQKVMPKGNLGRTINADGSLSGGVDTTYATSYAYYPPGATAVPPPSCGGAAIDQGGEIRSVSVHGVASATYVWNAAGDLLAKTSGIGTTCYTRNAEDRLTSETAPGDEHATVFVYDPAGNQLSETDGAATITSVLDEAGRVTQTTDASGAQASFVYDASGNVLRRTTATGSLGTSPHFITSYVYDAANELASETDPAGRQYQFYYDSRGNLHATQYPNGTFSWSDYGPDGWLTDLYNRHGTLSAPLPFSAPTDSTPIADYSYLYNQAGQKTQETLAASGQSNQVTQYSYDGLGRLDQAVLPDGTVRGYGYDADSNRTAVTNNGVTAATYTYDASATPGVDELTSVGSTTYAYTADGQVKSYGTNTVSWDGWGRITGGTFGGVSITYKYDPSGGLEMRTSSNGASTRYLLGDLFETDRSGDIQVAYVDGPAGDLAEYAGPPTLSSTLTVLYYNGHGDLAAEADVNGVRDALHTYDPFGAPTDSPPSDTTVHRYTGRWAKQYDTSSGLILMGARPYDPSLGRFLAVDPVDGGSLNNYDYADQDPINGYDLTGTMFGGVMCDGGPCGPGPTDDGSDGSSGMYAGTDSSSSTTSVPPPDNDRYKKDWGSSKLCADLHCTAIERTIIGQYEDRSWEPTAYDPIDIRGPSACPNAPNQDCGHAFGLGQLDKVSRQEYLGKYYATTDPRLQLYAMRQYIADRYGTESAALAHERKYGNY